MGIVKEFKEFAVKGNVMDLAIGVIIGAAFSKVVSSLVAYVIMPPIGVLLKGVDFTSLAFVIQKATEDSPAVVIRYGDFIQAVVDFLIVAFVMFLVMKGMNALKRNEEAVKAASSPPTAEVVLLGEIRDLLKDQK